MRLDYTASLPSGCDSVEVAGDLALSAYSMKYISRFKLNRILIG